MRGTYASLTYSRDAYYERYRFADVFAHLKRAPASVAGELLAVDGTRIKAVNSRDRNFTKAKLAGRAPKRCSRR